MEFVNGEKLFFKKRRHIMKHPTVRIAKRVPLSFKGLLFLVALCPALAWSQWMKMDPPPDVDKAAHGDTGTNSCWLATAANMLAGAGYGTGKTVQQRADDIYNDLVANYGTANGGWADTAISWWLSSANNIWPANPYDVVTVYGNKTKVPWADSNGARFMGNELRRCQFLGVSLSWPRTSANGSPYGGHAITCWGDSSGRATLTANPAQVRFTDSDTDNGGDVQAYTYDGYTNPNPAAFDEGNGWYFNYSTNHPFIKHIVTLCPTDNPGDNTQTQIVVGSYKIHQNNPKISATDLHYRVGTDVNILSYKTTIDWPTTNPPSIEEDATPARNLNVMWDLKDHPVPYCTWVTITTEFVVPTWNAIHYANVYFTPLQLKPFPMFRWEMLTPKVRDPRLPNLSGGYIIGAFDLMDPETKEVVGEYRLLHEYDFDQNPEHHDFTLESLEKMGYMVGNFRFGHSYGKLAPEELWHFSEWMTRQAEFLPLDQVGGLPIVLNWTGRLPYPEGEIVPKEIKPLICTVFLPQDFNHDCIVDLLDFAEFADVWLESTAP
jgi:hypothetical protein